MRKRKVWVEPLFGEAKEWHGLRRLRLRGVLNANIQGLLIAAGQNLKRFLAETGWGRRHAPCGSLVALPREAWRIAVVSGGSSSFRDRVSRAVGALAATAPAPVRRDFFNTQGRYGNRFCDSSRCLAPPNALAPMRQERMWEAI